MGLGAALDLDPRGIVALCSSCAEELEAKLREKSTLTRLLADLKKNKMQYDAKIARKKREVDTTVVQTMELENKVQVLSRSNKTVGAEVSGLRAENERVAAEVDHLKRDLREASVNYEKEVVEVERLRQLLYTYRKEVGQEAKQRDTVHQDLRATRTAQSLMITRLDDMEKRNKALKTCVADTFAL